MKTDDSCPLLMNLLFRHVEIKIVTLGIKTKL